MSCDAAIERMRSCPLSVRTSSRAGIVNDANQARMTGIGRACAEAGRSVSGTDRMGRVLNAMSLFYGTAAAWRRGWYDRHPARRQRLDSPVVSVGNLSVGGSGKTPVVRALAQL